MAPQTGRRTIILHDFGRRIDPALEPSSQGLRPTTWTSEVSRGDANCRDSLRTNAIPCRCCSVTATGAARAACHPVLSPALGNRRSSRCGSSGTRAAGGRPNGLPVAHQRRGAGEIRRPADARLRQPAANAPLFKRSATSQRESGAPTGGIRDLARTDSYLDFIPGLFFTKPFYLTPRGHWSRRAWQRSYFSLLTAD